MNSSGNEWMETEIWTRMLKLKKSWRTYHGNIKLWKVKTVKILCMRLIGTIENNKKANSTAFREFKRIVAEQLVSPLVAEAEERRKKKEKAAPKTSPAVGNRVFGSTTGTVYMLLENKEKQDVNCFLCMLSWKIDPDTGEKWVPKLLTIYGCCECKKGFHVNCFAAFHHKGALKGDTRALMDIILKTSSEKIQKGMSKVCKQVASLSDLKLKFLEEFFKKFESKRQKLSHTVI